MRYNLDKQTIIHLSRLLRGGLQWLTASRPVGMVNGKQLHILVLLVIYELRGKAGRHIAELELLRDVRGDEG